MFYALTSCGLLHCGSTYFWPVTKSNDPKNSQTDPSDFVVSLLAGEIRHKTVGELPLRQGKKCSVEITPDPLPGNSAHALIRAVPDLTMDEKTLFKKLRTALARLARWEIGP
jgi:hypothetical protein